MHKCQPLSSILILQPAVSHEFDDAYFFPKRRFSLASPKVLRKPSSGFSSLTLDQLRIFPSSYFYSPSFSLSASFFPGFFACSENKEKKARTHLAHRRPSPTSYQLLGQDWPVRTPLKSLKGKEWHPIIVLFLKNKRTTKTKDHFRTSFILIKSEISFCLLAISK